MRCQYKYKQRGHCDEKALPNYKYCILHVSLPKDEESDEFKKITELKQNKIEKKLRKKDFNFEGVRLYDLGFYGITIPKHVNLFDTVIKQGIYKLNKHDKAKCHVLDEFLSCDNISIESVVRKHEREQMDKKLEKRIKQLLKKQKRVSEKPPTFFHH